MRPHASGTFVDTRAASPGPRTVLGAAIAAAGETDSEAALLARLRERDEAAFAELIERYGARLLATARRFLKSEEDAQDAVQEAFLSAFRSLDAFHGNARLGTWLHRIAINAALMRRRSRQSRRDDDIESLLPEFNSAGQFLEPPSCWTEAADAGAERQETRAIVRACIDELPESYRTALVLREIEELETDEVAQHLGISTNAVKIRVHRARQALRTLLDRRMHASDA